MNVDVIALTPGARPPESADWIAIEITAPGRYNVAGCIAGEPEVVFAAEAFECFEHAQLAGVFWARNRGVKVLYVERVG